jgi:ribosome-associated protein|tara:strand:+ start:2125 stop:2472 length:348 start_codon:yes stop_codon:yes gene_type:complete
MDIKKLKSIIENVLNSNKANNITSISLENKSFIADYMIIASGTSSRHLQSLSELVVAELKNHGINNCRIEGRESNHWKLVDAMNIIVHIFRPDKREFYDLENMWSEPTLKEKVSI